jgi:hypothetical protein
LSAADDRVTRLRERELQRFRERSVVLGDQYPHFAPPGGRFRGYGSILVRRLRIL